MCADWNNGAQSAQLQLRLQWKKCAPDPWCPFETVVLPDANASGILVVWTESVERILYVGQGGIAMNLKWARQFAPITAHRQLFATWANVPEDRQNGVRNYLVEKLRPAFCDRPTADPRIAVNLPWD